MSRLPLLRLAVLCLSLSVCAGCAGQARSDEEAPGSALTGTPKWVLGELTLNGKKLALQPGQRATLSFEKRRVSGDTGCNLLSGKYRAKGDGTIVFPEISVTERACEHLAFETKYLQVFGKVKRYEVIKNTLVLSDGTAANRLEFVPFKPTPLPLEGTTWELTHFTESDAVTASATGVLGPRAITFRVEKGRATGSAGCNDYFGKVTFPEDGQLTIGPLASTKKACGGDIMTQESKFLRTLGKMTKIRVNESVLTLSNADGTIGLQFQGAKPE